jgi:hypothetical protein
MKLFNSKNNVYKNLKENQQKINLFLKFSIPKKIKL